MADNKSKKSPGVPPLRFPGFTDDWKKTTFGEIVQVAKNKISSSGLNSNNYISTVNILPNFAGVKESSNIPEDQNETKFTKGDILFANIRPYLRKIWLADRSGGCNADVFVFRPKTNSSFVYYSIANDKFCDYVMSGAKGVKMPRGDKEQILKFEIGIPSDKEQRKIATLLSLIDERIATQNKIIEDLKKLRSAIYDKVFHSLNGKKIPLGDVADIVKGKQVNGEFLTEVGDYYVMNGGTEPSGYYHDCNTSANTISISEGGNSCGYIQWNSSPFWSGGHCYTLKIIDSAIANKFLYHFLKWQETDIMKLRIGSGLPNIQKKDLAKVIVEIPIYSQQVKTVHFLDAYDNKIENEKYILGLYTRQKSFLLSSMFI